MSVELDDAACWAWWERQSAAQGLSPKIADDDPSIVRQVAVLALGTSPPNGSAERKGGAEPV
jgi:hypothetical protein